LSGNVYAGDPHNFDVISDVWSGFVNYIDTSNLVDGKPVYYLINQSSIVISPKTCSEGVGYLGLVNCANVTVQGLTLTKNGQGLLMANTTNSKILDNNVTANSWDGIYLYSSSDNVLSGNNVTANSYYGIQSSPSSDNNTLSGNNVTANGSTGIFLDTSEYNVLSDNSVTANGGGIVLGTSSEYNVLSDNSVTADGRGIFLDQFSRKNVLSGNNVTANGSTGIFLAGSSANVLSDNSVTANGGGIVLGDSGDNVLSDNSVTANGGEGINLYSSGGDVLSGNNVTANGSGGIFLDTSSDDNVLSGNSVRNDTVGIELGYSDDNVLSGNNVTANSYGIWFSLSSDNTFYHNNFVGNAQQVSSDGSPNTWDNGYPSGGNYWSDYQTTYPNATEIDGSGIWNTPYVIDTNNIDQYPLMNPYTFVPAHDVAVTDVTSSKNVVGQGYSLNVAVTAADQGGYTETFNVTAYANSTVIGSENVTLSAGNSATVTFTWNTNGFAYGDYTISAYALLVPGETNTGNNNISGGTVYVGIPGDVDGIGRVNMNDVVSILKAFGSTVGEPNYNPNCDINGKGRVDMSDLVIALHNFGQHYP
jgi:parallel beta-helix repeat protein